jgi:subtilisin family serine protease
VVDVRNRRPWWRALGAAAATCSLIVPVGGISGGAQAQSDGLAVPEPRSAAGVYIVRMADPPAVAYEGGRPGLPATSPGRGERINPNSAAVRQYAQFLDGRHAAALAAAGAAGAKFYDYRYSFNGFAATLTQAQAARLASRPDVISVSPDERREPLTDNTPSFLGLTGGGGLWSQLGGQGSAGENVVIGVIDTGIWPEHPSFSDQADLADRPGNSGKALRVYDAPPSHWHGTCQAGERWSKDDCNNKLIGARYFLAGLAAHGEQPGGEYASARDHDGHGTHTASTAGGNAGVDPAIFGRDLGVDTISGMAPRARIAAYKGCFGEAGCVLSDLVAAIDTAVADGVDVINYSIGSATPQLLGSDDVAFLFAADAGVFVATSAGNSGPGASTIGSPSADPWVTTVGASTHDRYFLSTIALGSGASYAGGSVGVPLAASRLVDGDDNCLDGLDPAVVTGAIVLCERITGVPRVSHGAAVAAAGGVGMILFDPPQSNVIPTDNHVVPTVHVFKADALAIRDYIESAGPSATASFSGGNAAPNPAAPDMAVFSSRGPNGGAGDIIKPDVTAPGVQVLAGNSPTPFLGAPGQLFQAIQGTSMSSPHVAGVGALLVQAHPTWTPAMIKSALMTTGHQDVDKENGSTAADPFDFGGGHIAPTPANGPGLVYDAGLLDYVAFLCGDGELPTATCVNGFGVQPIDPSDLNLASIGVEALAGVQTVTRTVTNVGAAGTYSVSVEAPAGIAVEVSPDTLTLGAGASGEYEVTFTTTDGAALDEWAFGSLTWTDGSHTVRSPIAVRPVALAFPAEVSGTGTSGNASYEVTFGYTGPFNTAVHGLMPATVTADTVVDDPANDINVALATGVGIDTHTIAVATDARHLRASLFDDNTDGEDDLDLYLFDPDGDLVAVSGTATSAEQVDVADPANGDWTLIVHGWQTDGPDAEYDLFTWQVGDSDAGNLTVTAPTTATLGETATIELSWSGLTADTRYLGAVSYHDGSAEIGSTLVSIAA